MIENHTLDREALISFLDETDENRIQKLFADAYAVKVKTLDEYVYLRGLVEISNICRKNCLYCGIRSGNKNVKRYELSDDEIIAAARFSAEAGYGSLVIQSGERNDARFIARVTSLLKKIKQIPLKNSPDKTLGITLSCGEQSEAVYNEWFESGAHRYLLRIESSTRELYEKIHPDDRVHSFDTRIQALADLKKCGYQVGTGVMIGLPFQTTANLADDLLFFKHIDIDMCGMGPYLEHSETPLYQYRRMLLSKSKRMELTLKMVALLRLLMPDVNIAATTAMQAIDPLGREKAILAGANVIMPNLTVADVRSEYQIYENKPGVGEDSVMTSSKLEHRLQEMKIPIGYNRWGDAKHFKNRQ